MALSGLNLFKQIILEDCLDHGTEPCSTKQCGEVVEKLHN
jgi:hypothetical protein